MKEIITLHCGIENCSSHYEYKHNEDSIVAICASWHNEKSRKDDSSWLLAKQPMIGETYEISINFPISIDLAQHFWVTYFDPYSECNGLDSEQGIDAMLFCLCQKKNIIDVGNHRAKIEVEVLNSLKVTEGGVANEDNNKRTKLLDEVFDSHSISIEKFEHFIMISANYQGDFGWTYIIEKKHDKCILVAENNWDFHRNIWTLTNEELGQEQEQRYGIHQANG